MNPTTVNKRVGTNKPLVVNPRDGLLVAEGSAGVLQFYNPITDQ